MSWITLAETHILTASAGPRVAAARTAALKAGQADPLQEIFDQVTTEVRGRVAACARNTLGEAGTIPDECKAAAIDMCVYRLSKRLDAALLSAAVTDANNNAIAFMRDVARCEVAIVPPVAAAPGDEQAGGGSPVSVVNTRPVRTYTRDSLSGL